MQEFSSTRAKERNTIHENNGGIVNNTHIRQHRIEIVHLKTKTFTPAIFFLSEIKT
jgi:hypothetical protein